MRSAFGGTGLRGGPSLRAAPGRLPRRLRGQVRTQSPRGLPQAKRAQLSWRRRRAHLKAEAAEAHGQHPRPEPAGPGRGGPDLAGPAALGALSPDRGRAHRGRGKGGRPGEALDHLRRGKLKNRGPERRGGRGGQRDPPPVRTVFGETGPKPLQKPLPGGSRAAVSPGRSLESARASLLLAAEHARRPEAARESGAAHGRRAKGARQVGEAPMAAGERKCPQDPRPRRRRRRRRGKRRE
mmetsp:Transcript_49059/g.111281  ORF Transcript_49059/g.111281 Transcript_49059/m.111281 type:complete len:239 (-) Transcript_49059:143-859(-)